MLKLNFTQQLGSLNLVVNETLPATGVSAIFGLSGAGKTSLINVISGLTSPDTGGIYLNDRPLVDVEKRICLGPNKRRIGYVFQDARLFPHYTVKGNLLYGVDSSVRDQYDSIVELLGISALQNRYPATLSGGEKQRVAIGRALLTAPDLLLMDEPLASLDLPRKRELLPYLERLSEEVNIPILYVSHSIEEIVRLAKYILVLNKGKVLACGELEKVWMSDTLRPWLSQELQNSILKVQLHGKHPDYPMTSLSLGNAQDGKEQLLWVSQLEGEVGEELVIQINASDVSIVLTHPENSSIRNIIQATVTSCHPHDKGVDIKLSVGSHIIWAQISRWAFDELGLKTGMQVFAQIKTVSLNRVML